MQAKPKFKTRCIRCGKYDVLKYGWNCCNKCREERIRQAKAYQKEKK